MRPIARIRELLALYGIARPESLAKVVNLNINFNDSKFSSTQIATHTCTPSTIHRPRKSAQRYVDNTDRSQTIDGYHSSYWAWRLRETPGGRSAPIRSPERTLVVHTAGFTPPFTKLGWIFVRTWRFAALSMTSSPDPLLSVKLQLNNVDIRHLRLKFEEMMGTAKLV